MLGLMTRKPPGIHLGKEGRRARQELGGRLGMAGGSQTHVFGGGLVKWGAKLAARPEGG